MHRGCAGPVRTAVHARRPDLTRQQAASDRRVHRFPRHEFIRAAPPLACQVVLIEVLSESTERYDRDGKFQLYKQIASLREYVLIAQHERRIEVFRHEHQWRGEVAGPGSAIRIRGALVEVDRVYRA